MIYNIFFSGSDILAVPVMQQDANNVEAYFPGNRSTIWYRVDNDKWTVFRGGNKAIIDADINTVGLLHCVFRLLI